MAAEVAAQNGLSSSSQNAMYSASDTEAQRRSPNSNGGPAVRSSSVYRCQRTDARDCGDEAPVQRAVLLIVLPGPHMYHHIPKPGAIPPICGENLHRLPERYSDVDSG